MHGGSRGRGELTQYSRSRAFGFAGTYEMLGKDRGGHRASSGLDHAFVFCSSNSDSRDSSIEDLMEDSKQADPGPLNVRGGGTPERE